MVGGGPCRRRRSRAGRRRWARRGRGDGRRAWGRRRGDRRRARRRGEEGGRGRRRGGGGRRRAPRPAGRNDAIGRTGAITWTGRPDSVTPAGANTRTLLTTFTLFTVTCCTNMPGRTMGGALTTTAGWVPMGAGTMMPAREPGGGG